MRSNRRRTAITLTFSGSGELRKFGAMHGFAYLNGTDLQLLFSAAKALSLVQQVGEKAASLTLRWRR